MKKIWSKIELKIKIGICFVLGGFLILLLGQMIMPVVLGKVLVVFGGSIFFLGCTSLIAYWIEWREKNKIDNKIDDKI